MTLCRADGFDHFSDHIKRICLIDYVCETRRFDRDGGVSFQAEEDLIGAFTAASSNPLCQKLRSTFDGEDSDTGIKSFRVADHAARDIDDCGCTLQDRRKTLLGYAIEETMSPPMQGKLADVSLSDKIFWRQRVVVLRINLGNPRNNTAWEDKTRFISKLRPREINKRVFAASRRSNNEN